MSDKIKKIFAVIRSIIPTMYFNLHYLPINQAVYLPIILYKPKLYNLNGKIIIRGKVKTGMIRMGFNLCNLYPQRGMMYENHGGTIIFNGRCVIGNDSCISIGKTGYVEFGDNFGATAAFKLVSYHHISFDENVLFGWECIVSDTDLHQVQSIKKDRIHNYGKIHIAKCCWIAMRCEILKNTEIPEYSIVSAGSLVCKKYCQPYTLLGGVPAVILKEGIYRDPYNDNINYQEILEDES